MEKWYFDKMNNFMPVVFCPWNNLSDENLTRIYSTTFFLVIEECILRDLLELRGAHESQSPFWINIFILLRGLFSFDCLFVLLYLSLSSPKEYVLSLWSKVFFKSVSIQC